MNQDYMKEKPVFLLLVSMGVPMIVSMIAGALYNIVDSIFVAGISEDAMTALSLVFPIQNLAHAAGIGFGIGINAMIARLLGENRLDEANAAASQGLFLSLLHGLALMAAGYLIMPHFLSMFTEDPQIIAYGLEYSSIVFLFAAIDNKTVCACLKGLLEMTIGTNQVGMCDIGIEYKTVLAAMLVSFGGLSVAGQSASMTRNSGLGLKDILLMKLTHGMLAAIFAILLTRFVVL